MGSDRLRLRRSALPGVSIHAPRVGSDVLCDLPYGATQNVSIHAPRVGSDAEKVKALGHLHVFQSTLPAWGATIAGMSCLWRSGVSIHAPRVGSDSRFVSNSKEFVVSIHAPRVGSDDRLS